MADKTRRAVPRPPKISTEPTPADLAQVRQAAAGDQAKGADHSEAAIRRDAEQRLLHNRRIVQPGSDHERFARALDSKGSDGVLARLLACNGKWISETVTNDHGTFEVRTFVWPQTPEAVAAMRELGLKDAADQVEREFPHHLRDQPTPGLGEPAPTPTP